MSPFWSAATIASVADSATERKRLSDSRRASASCAAAITRPSWRPMCAVTSSRRSSGVTALTEKHSMTAKVLVADRDREAERALEAHLGGDLRAREVRVALDVHDPGGAAGGGDAAREADAAREVGGLGQRAEGLELGRVTEVPEVRRLERVVLLLAGEVHVADGPARPAADVLDAGEQGLVDVVDLGGGGGDGLDQRDERGVRGELAVRRGGGDGGGGGVGGEDAAMCAGHRGRRCGRGAGASERGDLGEGRLLRGSGHLTPFIGRPSADLSRACVRNPSLGGMPRNAASSASRSGRSSSSAAATATSRAVMRICSTYRTHGSHTSRCASTRAASCGRERTVEIGGDELDHLPAADPAGLHASPPR